MSSPAEWASTKRGQKMLVDHLGYRYHYVKENENKSTWRCIERKTVECCKAYAIVQDDEIILRTEHKHSSYTKKSLVKKIDFS